MLKLFSKTTVCAVTLLAASLAQAQTSTLEKIKQNGAITIGARDMSVPFSYKVNGNSDPIGLINDICLKVAEAAQKAAGLQKMEIKYLITTPTSRIPLVQNGTVDLDCTPVTNTIARQEQVSFSPSYFSANVTLAVRKDSPVKGIADLQNRNVATVTGTTSIQLLRAYKKAQNVKFNEVYGKDPSEAFVMFESGKADAFVLDDVQLASFIATSQQRDQYVILNEPLRTEPYGVMLRKDDPTFKKVVDDTVYAMIKSGEMEALYQKWFMTTIPPRNVNINFPLSESTKALYANPNDKGI
ncbi:amino acid ABC transporter substrate-binding protein [Comamonas piscis]|uniref:Amino acid ABC transporter substrate-binding protein n=1 Tax=Comamonas piscis TaxID=1562974 RepID=A0A7G5ENF7_9BURK|nr:amino acid ABC transporter substrate-binding protein [Comamonas piscis]QMV75532.1 amino acid ABC transporter substrate-binding protein [Comamonas piscis]WSO34040.1 amino acid ABC transporter substrate-binding protein [Comamonas piscis]